jgi:hypothetical protein
MPNPHTKILDRVAKLMRLSKSTNEHEAANAASLAAELMIEHQISEAQIASATGADAADPLNLVNAFESKSKVSWRTSILSGLCYAFGVYLVTDRRERGTVKLMISGKTSAVDTVLYMFPYLCAETDRLADDLYPSRGTGTPRTWKHAFRLGCAATIRDRLVAQKDSQVAQARAAGLSLMRIDQAIALAKDHCVANMLGKGDKLSKSGSKSAYSNRDGFAAGKEAGKRVAIGRSGQALGTGQRMLGDGQ